MMQPECFLAFAPRGGGLLCAVTYVAEGDDVCGWFIGLRDYAYPSAYFRIERFFSADEKRFYATAGADVYGGWRFDYAKSAPVLAPAIPVDDALCHRLDRLQDVFAAGLVHALASGASMRDAMRLAVRFGTEATRWFASALPPEAVRRLLR